MTAETRPSTQPAKIDKKAIALGVVLVALLVGAGWRMTHMQQGAAARPTPDAPAAPEASGTCEHTIAHADCPFCTPSLIESKGWCNGHNVPEAVCTRCNKAVIPAFKAKGDWCGGHDLPESQCVKCNPELATRPPYTRPSAGTSEAPAADWCKEHGLPESDCFLCSPDLVEKRGMCAEHGLPNALCTTCKPALIPAFKAGNDWCEEHAVPESQCVTCNPALSRAPEPELPPGPGVVNRLHRAPAVRCTTHLRRIQLQPGVEREVGIETVEVQRAPWKDVLTCNAETIHAANRYAHLSSRVAGIVREVRTDLGRAVKQGDVLVLVDTPELRDARAEYQQAVELAALWERNHAREVELSEGGLATRRQLVEADTRRVETRAALARATQRLLGLGLDPTTLDGDDGLAIRAPFDGTIVKRDVVQGEVVTPGEALLALADTRTVWAMIDVREDDVARVHSGQPLVLQVDALRGEAFAGELTWVDSEVDRRTRTVKARAVIDNAAGLLRANLFGKARVTLADRADAIVIPREAVQWEGCCNVVFVRRGEGTYEPRKVRLGGTAERLVEVVEGLAGGEPIATLGSFVLKTEILKGSIGAGCCEGE